MHLSSLDKMKHFRQTYLSGLEHKGLCILDLGSQDVNGTYKGIFDSSNWKYVGVDMEAGHNVDLVLSNPYSWSEIKSGSVDVFISGQAFEHIEFFWLTMLEVSRVLKVGGLCCIIAPSSGPEHRYPLDCWRFYPDGFAALAKFGGLTPIEVSTQWEDQGYAEESSVWHDTLLIARKSSCSFWTSLKKSWGQNLISLGSKLVG